MIRVACIAGCMVALFGVVGSFRSATPPTYPVTTPHARADDLLEKGEDPVRTADVAVFDAMGAVMATTEATSHDTSGDGATTVDTGIYSATTTSAVSVPIESQVRCPFTPQSGRFVIDFTRDGTVLSEDLVVVAHATEEKAVRTLQGVVINPGRYAVQLASYHDPLAYHPVGEYEKRWYVELFDTSGTPILHTNPTSNIASDETMVIERVEYDMVLGTTTDTVVARHYAYPDTLPQAVVPVCGAFDRISTPAFVADAPTALAVADNILSIPATTSSMENSSTEVLALTTQSNTRSDMSFIVTLVLLGMLLFSVGALTIFGGVSPTRAETFILPRTVD